MSDNFCPTCGLHYDQRCADCRAMKTPPEVKMMAALALVAGVLALAALCAAIAIA